MYTVPTHIHVHEGIDMHMHAGHARLCMTACMCTRIRMYEDAATHIHTTHACLTNLLFQHAYIYTYKKKPYTPFIHTYIHTNKQTHTHINVQLVLPKILGSPPWKEGMSAAEILHALENWNESSVSPENAAFITKFADDHGDDDYFRPGPHLGGDAENALFEWCDSAVTLISM
jgi:hypothetical protein